MNSPKTLSILHRSATKSLCLKKSASNFLLENVRRRREEESASLRKCSTKRKRRSQSLRLLPNSKRRTKRSRKTVTRRTKAPQVDEEASDTTTTMRNILTRKTRPRTQQARDPPRALNRRSNSHQNQHLLSRTTNLLRHVAMIRPVAEAEALLEATEVLLCRETEAEGTEAGSPNDTTMTLTSRPASALESN